MDRCERGSIGMERHCIGVEVSLILGCLFRTLVLMIESLSYYLIQ
jgi:hypothetical protein